MANYNIKLNIQADVIIVGTGVSGLYAALNLPRDKKIVMITKSDLESSDSFLAQGGICVLKNDNDYDSYFEDTMRAGHYENNKDSVDIMIRSSQDVINDLIYFGVDFKRNDDGSLAFTREGAHSTPRILFHEDITGKEITSHLLEQVKKLENVTLIEEMTMLDIIEKDNSCYGIICRSNKEPNQLITITGDYTIWACGGIGGLFDNSTNFSHLTGDALAISLKHDIKLQNPDYIQIHPTTLYSKTAGRRFLISESVRGEGALLLNNAGEKYLFQKLKNRWKKMTSLVYGFLLLQFLKKIYYTIFLIYTSVALKKVMMLQKNLFQLCLRNITLWVVLTLIVTARQA